MVESKMAELKMAAIIKLSQNEWVKFILCKMAESKMVELQDGCHHQVNQIELVWVSSQSGVRVSLSESERS